MVSILCHWADRVAESCLAAGFSVTVRLRSLEHRATALERIHIPVFHEMGSHEVLTKLGMVIIGRRVENLVMASLLKKVGGTVVLFLSNQILVNLVASCTFETRHLLVLLSGDIVTRLV